MYRRILVPLDGSSFGEQALRVALGLATRTGAALALARVAEPAAPAPTHDRGGLVGDDSRERGRSEAAAYLETVAAAVRTAARERNGGGEKPETAVIPEGNVARSLARHGLEAGADLIVMATHGHGGLKRAWLGSTADALLRLVPCPILLIRPREGEEERRPPGQAEPSPGAALVREAPPFRHLLVPLDGSPVAEEALPHAVALLAGEPGRITLIRVVPDLPASVSPYLRLPADDEAEGGRREAARAYLEKVAGRLESEEKVKVEIQVAAAAQPAGPVVDLAREREAAGIALSSRGRGGVARLLLGSVADKVIRGASVPVLVCRAPEEED